jgi:hypothetical protein
MESVNIQALALQLVKLLLDMEKQRLDHSIVLALTQVIVKYVTIMHLETFMVTVSVFQIGQKIWTPVIQMEKVKHTAVSYSEVSAHQLVKLVTMMVPVSHV